MSVHNVAFVFQTQTHALPMRGQSHQVRPPTYQQLESGRQQKRPLEPQDSVSLQSSVSE